MAGSGTADEVEAKGFANPGLLCSAGELARLIGVGRAAGTATPEVTAPGQSARPGGDAAPGQEPRSAEPLVIDLRPAEDFAAGRIPGAVHLDLFGVSLNDTSPAPLAAFLSMIESLLASRGVAEDREVVCYDERTGARVARAFWFLDYFGHRAARVLDGGFEAWRRAGLPVVTRAVRPVKSGWSASARLAERVATWQDVAERLGSPDCVMLDTRSEAEYLGEERRARRAGAVPGAVHVEWTRSLDERGALRPADELRGLFASAGVTPDREVIAYCQSGYRAAHSYLALRLLGYPRVRNYLGSWKEWGDREDLPLERPVARERGGTARPTGTNPS